MVVDTSAVIAILTGEPEQAAFLKALESGNSRMMSVASVVEASIVSEKSRGGAAVRELDLFLATSGIELVAVDAEQARVARRAFSQYGKGRHRARLNFGDCFVYALAMTLSEPLLFKGDDFGHTDVELVDLSA